MAVNSFFGLDTGESHQYQDLVHLSPMLPTLSLFVHSFNKALSSVICQTRFWMLEDTSVCKIENKTKLHYNGFAFVRKVSCKSIYIHYILNQTVINVQTYKKKGYLKIFSIFYMQITNFKTVVLLLTTYKLNLVLSFIPCVINQIYMTM